MSNGALHGWLSMALPGSGQALQPRWQAALPQPGPGQVRIRVAACGVCRTDLHIVDGDLPFPGHPVVPGHEIVGRVTALGQDVSGQAIGQRVGVPWLGWTCGACDQCLAGRGGVALLRARRVLADLHGPSLDQDSGIRIVERALETPLRHIVANAGDEPSVAMHRVESVADPDHGDNAATRVDGNLLQMGVIDPATVTRLALQNAASIAALVLTTDCLIAGAPPREVPAAPPLAAGTGGEY